MSKLLSIIVPVYNVSKYINKCIDSIIAQTYDNIEIIIVDDGSPDDCPQICDMYAKKDSRIKVIHKQNGGLSSARNAGLDIAKGDYIGFVDSDDWIEPTMYEEMISFMESESCDACECAINLVDNSSTKRIKQTENEVLSGRDALKHHLNEFHRYDIPRPSVWSKLYKKDFWKTNRFPVGKIHEDYLLTCMVLYESKKYGIIHKGLYNHLTSNPTSIVNTKFSVRDLYKERQCQFRIDYLESKGDEELVEMAKVSYYCYLITAIWKCDQNNLDEKWTYVKLIQTRRNEIKGLKIPRNRKIDLFWVTHSPHLFFLFRRLLTKYRSINNNLH